MRITFISDTHSKHNQITNDLPGGDLLLHAGDMSSRGHDHEIINFLNWFSKLDNYKNKAFIAGNHDWAFQDKPEWCKEIIELYDHKLTYLQDDLLVIGEDYNTSIKIYGSPWQPEFFNWAFNLPRRGIELAEKWNQIPENTDILITHGPAYGYVDKVIGRYDNLGCELLTERIKQLKPKIHLCGHIHSGRNIIFNNGTLHINASILDENYNYFYKPITIDFDFTTNEWEIVQF